MWCMSMSAGGRSDAFNRCDMVVMSTDLSTASRVEVSGAFLTTPTALAFTILGASCYACYCYFISVGAVAFLR